LYEPSRCAQGVFRLRFTAKEGITAKEEIIAEAGETFTLEAKTSAGKVERWTLKFVNKECSYDTFVQIEKRSDGEGS
jgi:hypothetical protein